MRHLFTSMVFCLISNFVLSQHVTSRNFHPSPRVGDQLTILHTFYDLKVTEKNGLKEFNPKSYGLIDSKYEYISTEGAKPGLFTVPSSTFNLNGKDYKSDPVKVWLEPGLPQNEGFSCRIAQKENELFLITEQVAQDSIAFAKLDLEKFNSENIKVERIEIQHYSLFLNGQEMPNMTYAYKLNVRENYNIKPKVLSANSFINPPSENQFKFFPLILNPPHYRKRNRRLTREWRKYEGGSTIFEFIKLNPDGTGTKGYGRDFNGNIIYFTNDSHFLEINDWYITNKKLYLHTDSKYLFSRLSKYKFSDNGDAIILDGYHLRNDVLNDVTPKDQLLRKIRYEAYNPNSHDGKIETCFTFMGLLEFKKKNDKFSEARIRAVDDIIPHLMSCPSTSFDPDAVQFTIPEIKLLVPAGFNNTMHSYGQSSCGITMSEYKAEDGSFIGITYDIDGEVKKNFLKKIESGKINAEKVTVNGFEIFKYNSGYFPAEAMIFLNENIIVRYNTMDTEFEDLLLECVTSIKIKS